MKEFRLEQCLYLFCLFGACRLWLSLTFIIYPFSIILVFSYCFNPAFSWANFLILEVKYVKFIDAEDQRCIHEWWQIDSGMIELNRSKNIYVLTTALLHHFLLHIVNIISDSKKPLWWKNIKQTEAHTNEFIKMILSNWCYHCE